MQNADLRNKRYKQFLAKNESGTARKKIIFDFFFQLKSFFVSFVRFLNIVCPDRIQKSHSVYKKKLQSLN